LIAAEKAKMAELDRKKAAALAPTPPAPNSASVAAFMQIAGAEAKQQQRRGYN